MPDISKYPPKSDMVARKKYVKRYGLPAGQEHGAYAYRAWGCRRTDCICREAFATEQYNARQNRYERTIANGGVAPTKTHNANTYRNWGCRCNICETDYREVRPSQSKAA